MFRDQVQEMVLNVTNYFKNQKELYILKLYKNINKIVVNFILWYLLNYSTH